MSVIKKHTNNSFNLDGGILSENIHTVENLVINQSSAYELKSRHAVAECAVVSRSKQIMLCSSGLTQNL